MSLWCLAFLFGTVWHMKPVSNEPSSSSPLRLPLGDFLPPLFWWHFDASLSPDSWILFKVQGRGWKLKPIYTCMLIISNFILGKNSINNGTKAFFNIRKQVSSWSSRQFEWLVLAITDYQIQQFPNFQQSVWIVVFNDVCWMTDLLPGKAGFKSGRSETLARFTLFC